MTFKEMSFFFFKQNVKTAFLYITCIDGQLDPNADKELEGSYTMIYSLCKSNTKRNHKEVLKILTYVYLDKNSQ